jgi:putative transposase
MIHEGLATESPGNKMLLAHKIALDPTDAQRRYFVNAAGCDRFVWNLALEEWNRRYVAGEKPKAAEIKKDFNAFKYGAFPWISRVHRDAHADAFERLGKAWSAHFKNPKKTGRPTFHKKGRKDSFYVANDKIRIEADRIRLPIIGWVRMRSRQAAH